MNDLSEAIGVPLNAADYFETTFSTSAVQNTYMLVEWMEIS